VPLKEKKSFALYLGSLSILLQRLLIKALETKIVSSGAYGLDHGLEYAISRLRLRGLG